MQEDSEESRGMRFSHEADSGMKDQQDVQEPSEPALSRQDTQGSILESKNEACQACPEFRSFQ